MSEFIGAVFPVLSPVDLRPGDRVPGCGIVEWVELFPDHVEVDWIDGSQYRSSEFPNDDDYPLYQVRRGC